MKVVADLMNFDRVSHQKKPPTLESDGDIVFYIVGKVECGNNELKQKEKLNRSGRGQF